MTKTSLLVLSWLVVQAAQPRPAVLQGRVVRLGPGTPIPHARVVAAKVGGTQADYRTMVADEAGRFAFRDVTPGTYRAYATREGYLQGEYGRRAAGTSGVSIVLGEGQTSPDILISMTPTGAIAGRVLDRGKPVRNAWVRALKARYFDGQRSLGVVEWAQTDDRGEYRLFDLAPGFYVVSAIPVERPSLDGDTVVMPAVATTANGNQSARRSTATLETLPAAALERRVHPAVYHPGTTDPAAAQPVEVRSGQTAPGIDFTIATTPTFHVRGQVIIVGAESSLDVTVGARTVEAGTALPILGVKAQAGSFDLPRVPPGRYYLSAQTAVPPGPLLRNAIQIDVVNRDLDGVTITLQPGVQVTGRLSIEGIESIPANLFASVQLSSDRGTAGSTIRFQPDGTFTIDNVTPGEYRLRVLQGARTPWPWVKSARFGGEDVRTAPIRVAGDLQGRQLEIVLSANTATLDARVFDGSQRPLSGVLVIAVPDAARRNQSQAYRTATTDADGRARIDGLTPGEYTLFATESVEAGDWQDPAVLQRYERRGTAVRFREGGTETVTLRIIP